MSEEGYNGWTNYETWGCALIIDNDEGTYSMARDRAEEIREDYEEQGERVAVLADWLSDLTDTLCGLSDESQDWGIAEPSMMAQQLLNLGAIDFREIAENYLSELD